MSKKGEAENEEARAGEISEVLETTENLHRMYTLHLRRLGDAYESIRRIPYDPTLRAVDREVLNTAGLKISEQANLIRLRHEAGRMEVREAVEFMDATFGLLVKFVNEVHRSLPNAGLTLRLVIYKSMEEIKESTLKLLEATIVYGSHEGWCRVPDLALKVVDVCESLVKKPKTNSAAIQEAIARAGNDIEGDLLEMEKKAGTSTGGSHQEEASESKSDGKREVPVEDDSLDEERIATELAIHVVFDTVPVIEQLKDIVATWEGATADGLTQVMEGLLKMAIKTRRQVFKIKDSLFPLDVVDALRALQGMTIVTNMMEHELEPYRHSLEDFYQKLGSLRHSVGELKLVLDLMDPSSSHVGVAGLADDLHRCTDAQNKLDPLSSQVAPENGDSDTETE